VRDGKVVSDQHFVFFNNLTSPEGSVEHTGDNLTGEGEGEGDDEMIKVNLAGVHSHADARNQSFGQVSNAFIRW
jgi:tellurium resistance protein TerD